MTTVPSRALLALSDLKNWTTFHDIAQGNTFQWAGGNCIASLFVSFGLLVFKTIVGYLNNVFKQWPYVSMKKILYAAYLF